MNRVLIVGHVGPSRVHTGESKRLYYIIEALATRFSVDVLCCGAKWYDGSARIIQDVQLSPSKVSLTDYSVVILQGYSEYYRNSFAALATKVNPGIKIVLNTMDVHYLRLRKEYARQGRPESDAEHVEGIEKGAMNGSDLVLYVGESDYEELRKFIPEEKLIPVPILVGDNDLTSVFEPSDRRDLYFIGSFWHRPNVDSLVWFLKEVFPKVLSQDSEIYLNVVGSEQQYLEGTGLLEVFKESSRINMLGYVQDLDSVMRHNILVAPITFGAGQKVKILEAASRGVPVITTPEGVLGMGSDFKEAASVSSTAEDMASEILRVCRSLEAQRTLSDACFRAAGGFALSKHSEAIIGSITSLFDARVDTAEDLNFVSKNRTLKTDFCFVTAYRNLGDEIFRCLRTVLRYNPTDTWGIVVIDDQSVRGADIREVHDYLEANLPEERFVVIKNLDHKFYTRNLWNAVHLVVERDDSVIIEMDGDDFLAPKDVVSIVAEQYSLGYEMTFGSFDVSPREGRLFKPYLYEPIPHDLSNPWDVHKCVFWAHLKTYRKRVISRLSLSYFIGRSTGDWLRLGEDNCLHPSMMEMLGPNKVKYIEEVLYVYNIKGSGHDFREKDQYKYIVNNLYRYPKFYEQLVKPENIEPRNGRVVDPVTRRGTLRGLLKNKERDKIGSSADFKVAYSTVVFNREEPFNYDWTKCCLESFRETNPNSDLLIVDHNVNPEERAYLQNKGATIIDNRHPDKNHGFGIDLAIRHAKESGYHALILFDQDCVFYQEGWDKELIEAIKQGYWVSGSSNHFFWEGESPLIHPCFSAWNLSVAWDSFNPREYSPEELSLPVVGSLLSNKLFVEQKEKNPRRYEWHSKNWDTAIFNSARSSAEGKSLMVSTEGAHHFWFSRFRTAYEAIFLKKKGYHLLKKYEHLITNKYLGIEDHGDSKTCPVCGSTSYRFQTDTTVSPSIRGSVCPSCKSTPKSRAAKLIAGGMSLEELMQPSTDSLYVLGISSGILTLGDIDG